MLLTKSVALAILAAMGTQALVIPEANTIDVFGKGKANADAAVASAASVVGDAAKKVAEAAGNAATLFQSGRKLIPHKYIIVLKDTATAEEANFHRELIAAKHSEHLSSSSTIPQTFVTATKETAGGLLDSFNIGSLIQGYTGVFLDETIEFIRNDPAVAFVEQDSTVLASEFDVQKGAPWGLARVSHRQPLSLNSFNQYLFDNKAGEGVTSYVIDTGVNIEHQEFDGRATWGSTIPYGDADVDGNGHGTHCAGTIGSASYGVAKGVDIVAVKVLRSNGSGSMSDVVKGVEFAAKSHQDAVKAGKKGFKGSTANMSLGGGKSPALDLAVNAAVKAGLHFAVAAGNENQDACNTSPASAENAVTVGASTIADARAYFSNYGKCVDIFAPGLNILSTYIGSDSATATLSGTSMASPHIAGLLSYFLSLQPGADSEFFVADKGITPTQLKKNLIHYGSENILSDIPDDGTPNILAFNGAGHNLTGFWGADSKLKEIEVQGSDDLESKVEKLLSKVEKDSANVVDDIKKLVLEAYKNF
ncbi:subtilisin-like protease 3 [[Candida] anglica]|uniref:Subtilisin-like protease 3 n=1 Tax=[Candida] anglica TaxID=148631 RepID=A0ABP0E5P6_9ASCO